MFFTYVTSSDLAGIAIKGNNLIIKFNSGGIYEYENAAHEYNNLLNASSKGRYFHSYIKNYYNYRRLV